MVETLLDGECELTKNCQIFRLEDVQSEIDAASADNSLIVLWVNSGFYKDNPTWHSYLVFSANPLKSVAAWEKGIETYGREETLKAINNTICSDKHNKVITVHKYQRVKSIPTK